ncbi:unnamed protein product [Tenebrio molitor]|nr:unnamed protein product [Tenebrio molitor]
MIKMVKLLLEYLFYLLNSVLLILIKCISRSKFTSLTLNNSYYAPFLIHLV